MPAFRWQQAGHPGGRSLEEEKLIMTLQDAKVGTRVTVRRINGEGAYKRRIMDMGITKGSEIHIRKVAPLGDPVEITVRGYELSLRKADAACVDVEPVTA